MEQFRFRISISESDLTDLRYRLRYVKWPSDPDNSDWYYGVNLEYLKELVGFWRRWPKFATSDRHDCRLHLQHETG